ncbi:MAG TPA: hypothetical protein VM618_11370, partial [Acidimicrobiia bacterium]|nr:hypothetical protein [Acidimicrobiia bacterium]
GVPEELTEAELEAFEYQSVFVPIDGGFPFVSYRYAGADTTSSFLGVLDSQVGGFVLPSDQCDEAVIAPFVSQEMRPVVGSVARRDGEIVDVPVALVVATVVDPEVQASPAYAALWAQCLAVSAEEMTDAVLGTLDGLEVFNLVRETAVVGDDEEIDLVTWREEALTVMVFSTFALAPGGTTGEFLATAANPVEPGLEIANAIASRTFDPTDVLVAEALAPTAGFAYTPVTGVSERVRAALRFRLADQGVALETDPSVLVRRVEERAVEGGAGIAAAQAVVWDAGFMNSASFRQGWLEGVRADADGDVTTIEKDGARVYAEYTEDGIFHAAWVSECYTTQVTSPDAATATALADALLAAQQSARLLVFGVSDTPDADEVAGSDAGDAGEDPDDVDPTAVRDARNARLCASTNLRLFGTGFPVTDADADGIADRIDDDVEAND